MFGFGKKKKQKQLELDAAFEGLMDDINAIDAREDPNKIHRYILESCEQIISRAKIIKKEQTEYEVLTKYLSDIKKIRDMDERSAKRLTEIAENVIDLERTRYDYQQSDRRLPEEQFALLEENEAAIPETIRSMQENEKYQDKVRRDMQLLEGKKSEYEIELERLREEDIMTKKFSLLGLGFFGSLTALLLMIHFATGLDTTWGILAIGFCLVVLIMVQEYRAGYARRAKKETSKSLNKTISMVNVVRMKYANVTAQVDYEKDKFDVNNSHELTYLWERYLADVRDKEQYERDNEDYVYFNRHLVKLLDELALNDSRIWLTQTEALVDSKGMEEIYHKLVTRRKKVRGALEENLRYVRSERDEVTRLMREHDYYEAELIEIIATIDEEMGWNKNYQIIKAQKGAKNES